MSFPLIAPIACTRCGVLLAPAEWREIDGQRYCITCADRPDVDYLEAFRRKYWGKRDGWAWLYGIGALLNLGYATLALRISIPLAILGLISAALGIAFWLGIPAARPLTLARPFLTGGLTVITRVPGNGTYNIVGSLVAFLVALAVYFDTRNRLFFRIEVSREKLRKAWDQYANNSMARLGVFLSVFGLLIPGLPVLALICSFIGLRRVDPGAHPPIGRKSQATAGLVLGGLGLVWNFVLLSWM